MAYSNSLSVAVGYLFSISQTEVLLPHHRYNSACNSRDEALNVGAMRPDLTKRGALRSVFDGRHQFTRYFSLKQHNRPITLDALFKLNDVELFDLEKDPFERNNLALERDKHRDILETMNAKLNALIDKEIGEDVGQMLPASVDRGWVATPAVKDL